MDIFLTYYSEHFKQNPKSLSYLGLILHTVKSSQFVSFGVFDMSEINEQRFVKTLKIALLILIS